MTGVSILGSWGPWLSVLFIPRDFLVRGRFAGGLWGFGCASWGFGVVPESVESDA